MVVTMLEFHSLVLFLYIDGLVQERRMTSSHKQWETYRCILSTDEDTDALVPISSHTE